MLSPATETPGEALPADATTGPDHAAPRPAVRLSGSSRRAVTGIVVGGAVAALATVLGGVGDGHPDRSHGLASDLTSEGLIVTPDDVVWVDGPAGFAGSLQRPARAVVRGRVAEDEPNDVYLVTARLSPDGVLLGVRDVYNLTETTGADESKPIVRGDHVAYVSRSLLPGAPTTVSVLDLRGAAVEGEEAAGAEPWSRLERTQQAITNYQKTGQLAGVGRRLFVVESESPVELRFEESAIRVAAGTQAAKLSLDPGGELPPAWIRVEDVELARPGSLVTWSVDRVRTIPWFGDENMQRLKEVAFAAKDFVLRHKEEITGDTGEASIAEELGQEVLAAPTQAMVTDPEIGWPPAPLEPWVNPSLPGEGQWNPKEEGPFHLQNPHLPPAFLTTFIRTDRSRRATRVFVALWDPRQIELHMMPGRVEPKSATGKAGPGLIPRTPEVMSRLVATSNAGFQALHGEYGMMAEGVVYLPPKPYTATVMKLDDGSTAFGTWNVEPTVPDHVVSYRQNMTVMVQDEKFNPYGRTWWGGAVPGAEDKTHTVRTGICLTREHFVAYFYGDDLSPKALARAMIQARCKFGIALDMNAGHSGLEFYRVMPEASFEPLGRPLKKRWEYEGDVPDMDGWKFRRRGIIRGMGLMYPPRYIKREARDFFYMTLRHLLPGEPIEPVISPAEEGEGEWTFKGLPQRGFPYAMSTTRIRLTASDPDSWARVLKLDPRAVEASREGEEPAASPAGGSAEIGATVAVLDAGEPPDGDEGASMSLWHARRDFLMSTSPPVGGAARLASSPAGLSDGVAAIGVQDHSGMLVYAEHEAAVQAIQAAGQGGSAVAAPSGHGDALLALLERAGCSQRMLLSGSLRVALGGDTDLAGEATHPPGGAYAVTLVRTEAPGGRRIFEATPVVPLSTWYPLQQHRVRYFKKKKTPDETSD